MTRDIAILTGDLIGSTKLTPAKVDQAIALLHDMAGQIGTWQSPQCDTRFTRYRGDGWQLYLQDTQLALRAALCLRAALRSADKKLATRISIAAGQGTLPGQADLNTATGPVFTASGHGLDQLNGVVQMVHAQKGALAAVARLADHISQGWTPAQARAMREMLVPSPPTRTETAQKLGISQQAVGQALAAAGFGAIQDALKLIEAERENNA